MSTSSASEYMEECEPGLYDDDSDTEQGTPHRTPANTRPLERIDEEEPETMDQLTMEEQLGELDEQGRQDLAKMIQRDRDELVALRAANDLLTARVESFESSVQQNTASQQQQQQQQL